jgi:hypothetical protein
MREPGENRIKAWSREYEETPFFFEQNVKAGHRLIAWAEDSTFTKRAFYRILESFPQTIEVLLKIGFSDNADTKPLWSRYHGLVDKWRVTQVIQENEIYVFSDGAHQLCFKEPQSDHYLAFDEHGIFFLYAPTAEDDEIFRSLGFESRHAEPIYSKPHFQHLPPEPEKLEMKFVSQLGLIKANSDLD